MFLTVAPAWTVTCKNWNSPPSPLLSLSLSLSLYDSTEEVKRRRKDKNDWWKESCRLEFPLANIDREFSSRGIWPPRLGASRPAVYDSKRKAAAVAYHATADTAEPRLRMLLINSARYIITLISVWRWCRVAANRSAVVSTEEQIWRLITVRNSVPATSAKTCACRVCVTVCVCVCHGVCVCVCVCVWWCVCDGVCVFVCIVVVVRLLSVAGVFCFCYWWVCCCWLLSRAGLLCCYWCVSVCCCLLVLLVCFVVVIGECVCVCWGWGWGGLIIAARVPPRGLLCLRCAYSLALTAPTTITSVLPSSRFSPSVGDIVNCVCQRYMMIVSK